jgi:hypothetical protein
MILGPLPEAGVPAPSIIELIFGAGITSSKGAYFLFLIVVVILIFLLYLGTLASNELSIELRLSKAVECAEGMWRGKGMTMMLTSGSGLFLGLIGPGCFPGGTGIIVMAGIGGTGGKGCILGGQKPIVIIISRIGILNFRHGGLGKGIGSITTVGSDLSFLTVVLWTLIFCVVSGVGLTVTTVVTGYDTECVIMGGVHVDRVG